MHRQMQRKKSTDNVAKPQKAKAKKLPLIEAFMENPQKYAEAFKTICLGLTLLFFGVGFIVACFHNPVFALAPFMAMGKILALFK